MNGILSAFSRRPKREKMIFYAIVFVLALVFLEQLILEPILGKMRALDQEIGTEEARIKKNLHILAQKDTLKKEIDYFDAYAGEQLSQEEQTVGLLQEIEEMANKTALYVIDIKAAGLSETEQLRKFLVKLNCEAQLQQLTNFFYDVESSKKLLKIEDFDIRPKTEGSSVVRCTITISKAVLTNK
ncbi:MAG: type 4a pilus biogenesis protein PilO [Candidatus Omnitrophota bacterium]